MAETSPTQTSRTVDELLRWFSQSLWQLQYRTDRAAMSYMFGANDGNSPDDIAIRNWSLCSEITRQKHG